MQYIPKKMRLNAHVDVKLPPVKEMYHRFGFKASTATAVNDSVVPLSQRKIDSIAQFSRDESYRLDDEYQKSLEQQQQTE